MTPHELPALVCTACCQARSRSASLRAHVRDPHPCCAGACVPATFGDQWCTYWLHSGHLSIDGLKMSKSLKNFITIREALAEFSARQLRLLFCLQAWHLPMTFNQQSRAEMVQKEGTLKSFFLNVQVGPQPAVVAVLWFVRRCRGGCSAAAARLSWFAGPLLRAAEAASSAACVESYLPVFSLTASVRTF